MKRKSTVVIALTLAIILLAGVFTFIKSVPGKGWDLNKFNSQKLKWRNCNDGYQCASFLVPIDYENLNLGTFRIQVLRHQANKAAQRLGSIVVNPGGPGGSGLDFAYNAENIVSQKINDRYDIVGFDGRGVGASDPIRCLSDKEEDIFLNIDGIAANQKQLNTLIQASKEFASACAKASGNKLGHLSTLENAKDMEILRNLLREPKLNYLGKSYGTYLGAIYISLFPEKVGRFVLDGAIDPNISISEQNLNQAESFEKAFENFLHSNREFSKREIQNFILKSGSNPIKDRAGRELTRSLLITSLAASLYDNQDGWNNLKAGLDKALNQSNPDLLLRIADDYNNRDSSGHFYNNQNDIGIAINCLDWQVEKNLAELKASAQKYIKVSPTFGPYIGYSGLPCLYWKAKVRQPNLPFKDIKSPPFIIIGVTKDPATPYQWSVGLAKSFPSSTLLTFVGEGHTGQNRGNSCIDNKVDSYFLEGALPANGAACNAGGN